jgi:hypothetical protein
MKLILGLADRVLFALALLLFMQLPQFIDHYTQRYAGYHQALVDSLAAHQHNADLHYHGDLRALIDDLLGSERPGIREMGAQLERDRQREARMAAGLLILREGNLFAKLRFLATDLDRPLAHGTLQDFKPGLPLTLDALVLGFSGAILASALFNGLLWLLGAGWRRAREVI